MNYRETYQVEREDGEPSLTRLRVEFGSLPLDDLNLRKNTPLNNLAEYFRNRGFKIVPTMTNARASKLQPYSGFFAHEDGRTVGVNTMLRGNNLFSLELDITSPGREIPRTQMLDIEKLKSFLVSE